MHFRRSTSPDSGTSQANLSDYPSQTFHPSFVPKSSGILGSAAAGTHYSGAKIHHRRSDVQRASGSRDSLVLSEGRTRLLNDLKELYSCRPSAEIFRTTWRKDAVFEDPLTHSVGVNEIASQWYAMPKVFSKSETVASRVLTSTHHPNRIIYSQTQRYTVKLIGSKRTVKSIILIDLDDNDKIIRLEDQWNGEEPPTAWGMSTLRRLNGRLTPWFVRLPKELHRSD